VWHEGSEGNTAPSEFDAKGSTLLVKVLHSSRVGADPWSQNIQDNLADNEQSIKVLLHYLRRTYYLTSRNSARVKQFRAETTEEFPVQAYNYDN
jgi:hypothetical protein